MKKLTASAVRKIVILGIVVLAGVAVAAPAAPAAPANVYCVDGKTMSAPVFFSYGGTDFAFDQASLESIINAGYGGFLVGIYQGSVTIVYPGTPLADLLEDDPPPDLHTVARGACAAASAGGDRSFWLCYSSGYPWLGSRADAMKLYDEGKGWKVPVAVKDDEADGPHIGNGITLSCNFAAYPVLTDDAVSTGGGEAFNAGGYAKVPAANRLDYTVVAKAS